MWQQVMIGKSILARCLRSMILMLKSHFMNILGLYQQVQLSVSPKRGMNLGWLRKHSVCRSGFKLKPNEKRNLKSLCQKMWWRNFLYGRIKTDSFFLFFTVLDIQCYFFLFVKRLPVQKLKHTACNRIYIVLCLNSSYSI